MALRSSLHIMQYSKGRRKQPPPRMCAELPATLRQEAVLGFDCHEHDLYGATVGLLLLSGTGLGKFSQWTEEDEDVSPRVEEFQLDLDVWQSVEKQELITRLVLECSVFLDTYERLVHEVILPYVKAQLVTADKERFEPEQRFFYQFPPTIRLQPGPGERYVGPHRDKDYGHQPGEINFWMPLSPYSRTQTTLWCESFSDAGDFHPLEVDYGEIAVFHGSLCRHYVPANKTRFTRVSLDFRVGVDGFFDTEWMQWGTKAEHARREAML